MMAADARRTGIDMADLNDLVPLSKRLNAATDELNQVLETVQNKLNDLALGVEAWLDRYSQHELSSKVVNLESTGRTVYTQQLGYGRFNDGWALLVRTVQSDQIRDHVGEWEDRDVPVEVDLKPLLRSARQLRVKAVDYIPPLIDALKDEAAAVIESVEKAKKIADSLK